ncbi:dipeptide/oligopeptide/nickel ABC transporter ATP-binding protein [Agromyces luteolus]|uniref:ATP-binding cassette domain-containing protein n=1 Tax=Agromyces luteolus TaxID=88373 RepID=A0A7C9HJN9_9MICO|nr:dipeptide/oligopeptide/nickel ABC transporter permease/ATP-binding protein [Agromyces luteolus]MUN08621.1 ATP-binding cassette domain-containing protein [Agromyces luteolus]GLK27161.1 dipeptide/oligopeptide/nickel ABC transporter ATP-binding protein [Agromyces luteolus]
MKDARLVTGHVSTVDQAHAASSRPRVFRRLLRNPAGLASLIFLVVISLAAVFAPLIMPHDPATIDIHAVLASPDATHWLGTDGSGRDVLSRLIAGGLVSLTAAALAVGVAAAIGIPSGLIAGYYGGFFADGATWIVNLLMALPGIVVLLAVRSVLGPSLWISMAIFGILMSPAFFRLVYAAVRSARSELFVEAAMVSGLRDSAIIARHVLGAVRGPIIVQTAILASITLAIQAGLGFLGFDDSTVPSWGGVLTDAFANIYRQPQLIIWPSIIIALTSVAFALLGNALRDELGRTTTRRRGAKGQVEQTSVTRSASLTPLEPGVLLRVAGLRIGYPNSDGMAEVVRGIDLEITRGSVHGLIGESGSGKTQTAWAILGLLPSTARVFAGSIQFDDVDLLDRSAVSGVRGRRIAYIPQEPISNLDPSFTVGSQLIEPLRSVLRMSKRQAIARSLELLARVGISDPERTFHSYPHEISGGMAQRVLIAGAVASNPDLLIADEPTTALDVTVQAEVLDLLREIQQDSGLSILLVTHNLGVVADICDHVSVMKTGQIVETGPVEQIFNHPSHEYTRELFGSLIDEDDVRPTPEPSPSRSDLAVTR